jgi:hypothetical protein
MQCSRCLCIPRSTIIKSPARYKSIRCIHGALNPTRRFYSPANSSSTNTPGSDHSSKTPSSPPSRTPEEEKEPKTPEQKGSMSERDTDLYERMRQAMGDADMANVEMEDGVPDRGMRRNVRANMFRII